MSLGDERLSSTDEKGNRIFIFPADVRGIFRKYRTQTQVLLILFFLILPWIHFNGTQLLLLDIPNRTFHILGFIFKAHDAPFIFLVLAIGTISLAFATAIFGRVWCGWACPQTVFIDGVYRRVEKWVLGSYIERRKLYKEKLSLKKISKYSMLWILYFLISTFIAHSFVAYFVGSERLVEMVFGSPEENWTAFVIVMSMTGLLMFDFGWFREQFCIIACPYGRIQSVLMDKKSLSILYDFKRGEPRKGQDPQAQGDCVNCRRCIEVCPTGIDIRRGIQLECIGCTACIDACDEIMDKVKKPRGLIRYSSEYELENKIQLTMKQRLLRPRVVIYLSVILIVTSVFFYLVQSRESVHISVLKAKEAPYTILKDQDKEFILNHFKLRIHNQSPSTISVQLMNIEKMELIIPQNPVQILSNKNQEVHFFVKFEKQNSQGVFKKNLVLDINSEINNQKIIKELSFVEPF